MDRKVRLEPNATAPATVDRRMSSVCRSRPAGASQAKTCCAASVGIHTWLARVGAGVLRGYRAFPTMVGRRFGPQVGTGARLH